MIRAVLFDVDFTLARPGPELSPEGYVRAGERHGLRLDAERYEAARATALVDLKRSPGLDHDEDVWVAFTRRIVIGMGGAAPAALACAAEIASFWQHHENFELYEDAIPVLEELRLAGLKIGLVSNSARDVGEFALHHALAVDAGISSFHHGKTKPHASIFRAVLELLEVEPELAVMVGDTLEDDIEGARALGMHAILIDRDGLHPEFEPRLIDLYGLPAALGLTRPG
ncbi:MAG: HAD family hydrolase [Gaiellaceae bacterium]